MHLSSLPGPHGIGTMGKAAREFVDFLQQAGQTYWQLLPVCPTGYGDSPYQSFSTFAGNPYFIDLDLLAEEGLLERSEYEDIDWECRPDAVNYSALYRKRFPVLRLAAERLLYRSQDDYLRFCMENRHWLGDYALFMTLKEVYGGMAWQQWPAELRERSRHAMEEVRLRYCKEVAFWQVTQYLFYRQWNDLRQYAATKGVRFIGDLPIYVSLDSADVWAHRELFRLDGEGFPTEVAGCPPDGFSADGQLWGNPLFDWERMAQDDYAWWVSRIDFQCRVYDRLRIDHFRGFDSYFAIPFGDENARRGVWCKGPGMALFRAVERQIGRRDIIAEDLGYLTDSVRRLLEESGFPGMKVLEFGFDRREPDHEVYLPHNYPRHCVAYVGTHDNDTAQGWMAGADPVDVAHAREYLSLNSEEGYHWGMMRALWASVADLAVVQAQDLLGLGSESRMNTPGSMGGNWCWRALPGSFTAKMAWRMRRQMALYGRLPQNG